MYVLCLRMRYDTIQLSVRREWQAALDDAGVREDPVADVLTPRL